MKESFYFPHDTTAHDDPKMMDLLTSCGLAGVGIYWIIIEILHQQDDGMISYNSYKQYIKFYGAFENQGTRQLEQIEQMLIKTGLLLNKENNVYSQRVLNNKEFRNEISEKRSIAGKASALKRAKNNDIPTLVEQNPTKERKGKERKGKEIKGKEIKEDRGEILKKISNTPEKDLISVSEKKLEEKESSAKEKELKEYGNQDINKMLLALKQKIGIDDFKDSQQFQRNFGKHLVNLLGKIGQEEFVRRLENILQDSFKQKNCNGIKYLYGQLKAYIEPIKEKSGLEI